MKIRGRAHKYGDNIDTDQIIAARYCTSYQEKDLAPYCLEDLDADFAASVNTGDVLVAGENFGCGSSRENAPIAIKGTGIELVVAKSFARIFYRNAINIALPILECPEAVDALESGHEITADLDTGVIRNLTTGADFEARPFPSLMREIMAAGGMIGFVRNRLEQNE